MLQSLQDEQEKTSAMKRKSVNSRVRLQPYVPGEISKRLEEVCASTNTTESAYVTAALEEHLNGTSDMTVIIRRLNRLGGAIARVHRDVELHMEAFGVFVRQFLAHAPPVAAERLDEMRARGEGRYKRFLERVNEQYSGGHRFVDDLPHDPIADEAELNEILSKTDHTNGRAR